MKRISILGKPGTDGTYPNFRLSQHTTKSPALAGPLQMVLLNAVRHFQHSAAPAFVKKI